MEKIDWQTANDPDPINYILKTYRDLLEDVIKKHPGQWVWWHRRWRRRPGVDYNLCPEKLLKTNDYITWMKGLGNSSKC